MRRWLAVLLVVALLSPAIVVGQTGGPWFRSDCTILTATTNQTLCWDTTAGILKYWDGASWATVGPGTSTVTPSAAGTVKLSYTNATTLTLNPGVIPLKVNGAWTARAIAAAVTVSNATCVGGGATAASTLYYIYAADSSGSTVATCSTTTHATDTSASGWGVETRSGDTTKTLVGMVYTDGSTPGQFQSGLLTLSYFNRRTKGAYGAFTADRSTSSATYVELNSEIRVPFVTPAAFNALMVKYPIFYDAVKGGDWPTVEWAIGDAQATGTITAKQYAAVKAAVTARRIPVTLS